MDGWNSYTYVSLLSAYEYIQSFNSTKSKNQYSTVVTVHTYTYIADGWYPQRSAR